MNTSLLLETLPPITHIFLSVATYTSLTIFFIMYGYWPLFTLITACALAHFFYKSSYNHLFVFSLCIIFSICSLLQVQRHYKNYRSNTEFLNTPLQLQAKITAISEANLTKPQITILVTSTTIKKKNSLKKSFTQNILITMPYSYGLNLKEGQEIEIDYATLAQPQQGCPYERYLIKEGIWATAFLTKKCIKIIKTREVPLYKKCFEIFSTHLKKSISDLYDPLFLGKRHKDRNSVIIAHRSVQLGIAHHMARSGIHLVTIFALLMTLLHYIRIRHSYRYWLGSAIAIGYFHITFPSISFIRALCMILLQMFSRINKLTYSSVHALTLTTLMIVLYNPIQIIFLDFQLSFGVTAIIIWLFQAKYAKTVVYEKKNFVPS